MTLSVRRLTLTTHITASVGWFGALAVFFAHALASLISSDQQIVRAASLAMGLTTWFVIVPLSLASVTTGLLQALCTAWGLFRHYWVFFKLLLTTVATLVLMLKLEPISRLADVMGQTTFSSVDVTGLQTSLMIHAAGGLLILLTVVVLAVYKPAGMLASNPPRWAKTFGVAVAVLLLLVFAMILIGGHGPSAH